MEKTILKLDFKKLLSDNQKYLVDVESDLKLTFNLFSRIISETERELKNRWDLILASDPDRILKKGFTLTLDEKNRIIKSLEEFRKTHGARLKFHDGITDIEGKEEK